MERLRTWPIHPCPKGGNGTTLLVGDTGAVALGGPAAKNGQPPRIPIGDEEACVGQAKNDLRQSLRLREHARKFPDAAFGFAVLQRAERAIELDRVAE